ncbi:tape measure protein [Oerskovia enterophila]|uniref:tape measure protein n=1 Tax=Oerskovia enterophila TaxID=43678 RepID=UPI0037FEE0B6
MAQELATAYLSLVPSLKGAGKTIGKELGSSEVQGEVESAGRKSGGGWVKGMGKVIGGAALAGIGIAAGLAIKGGLDRALSVENAEAKLTGLGHSADGVARIMDDALKSVKGTAFGMGEAATTAAGAVAAGVKPGADLERTLKLVADAATIAGTDMGSMGAIFNKVGASNKIQGDVIAQLGDQGIPILQFLAAEMGVTAEAAADMASKGQVDFDTFRNAMEAGLGGAALASGDTTQGAMKNMMASLSRAGESFLGGVFPMFKDGFSGITGMLDGIGPTAEAAGQFLGEALQNVGQFIGDELIPRVKELATWFSDNVLPVLQSLGSFLVGTLIPALVGMGTWIVKNKDWLIAVAIAVGGIVLGIQAYIKVMALWRSITIAATTLQAAFNAVLSANPIGLIILAIAALVGALVWFFTQTETGKAIVQAAWSGIQSAISAVASWWTGTAWPAIKAVIDWFGAAFQVAGTIISTVWSGIQTAIGAVWAWIRDNVFAKIRWWIDVIKIAFGLYRDAIVSAWNTVKDGLATGWQWISTNVFEPLKAGVALIGDAFENVKDAIGTAWDALKEIAAKPVNFILGTVYNDGIREWWNKISGAVGMDSLALPKANLVKFQSGGVMPGYTPGRDVHEFYSPTGGRLALSGGEAIMRPEFTRAVGGPAGVARLNMAARKGQAFKDGGVWDFFGDAWDTVKGVGKGIWDAAGMAVEVVKDPIGAIKKAVVDGIVTPLMSKVGVDGDFVKILTQLPVKWAGGLADKVKSMFASQESTMANGTPGSGVGLGMMGQMLQAILPGARVTSGFRSGARTAGFGAVSFHALGRALDIGAGGGRSLSQIWDVINAAYGSQSQELLYTPKGANQILRGGKRGGTSGVTAKNHYDHVHWAMANGGVIPGLYDNGGWIPDGGMALNLSGRPEAVLDPEESAALKNGLHNQGPLVNQIIVRDEQSAVRELEAMNRRAIIAAGLKGARR